MKIRPAYPADIQAIAHIGSLAFADEPIYEHFFPYRKVYPEDFKAYFVEDMTRFMVTPGHLAMVAELEGDDEQVTEPIAGSRVVAFATFVRYGTSGELRRWNPDSYYKWFWRVLLGSRSTVNSYIAPNRAISFKAIDSYYGQAAKIHAQYLDEDQGKLEFKTLAVHPAYQHRGYGFKLVQFCGYRASKEGVTVFGDASSHGLPLYVRNGCKEIGKIHLPSQKVDLGPHGVHNIPELDVVVLRWKADGPLG
ncbi:acyl-CoA N-acyltransferase [Aspergillus bertholletiae]|uniref:Acyl-CoA N-acyltransferase n=1 Tax=Aspergillus bertholletiae TaxID=1226010 RepID=A0A5N7AWX9_9EURO|nr:acyl-CoA N-acyltransferase [Aspergillus bertholletiae]